MQGPRGKYLLFGLLTLLAIVLGITLRGGRKSRPAPSTSGYYTGPMRNKNNPAIYTTEDGRKTAPPPGASTAREWTPMQIDKKGRVSESQ